ncbi:unnamed protein product [Spirodela intermedia]|uniref:Uncharacterized protein n=1 Tax=Spirodela intermedia TaxID=51605 RepID=A0A7I8LJF2_SPIIN|nr:unnamed protein product [Spirodela intermedia]
MQRALCSSTVKLDNHFLCCNSSLSFFMQQLNL